MDDVKPNPQFVCVERFLGFVSEQQGDDNYWVTDEKIKNVNGTLLRHWNDRRSCAQITLNHNTIGAGIVFSVSFMCTALLGHWTIRVISNLALFLLGGYSLLKYAVRKKSSKSLGEKRLRDLFRRAALQAQSQEKTEDVPPLLNSALLVCRNYIEQHYTKVPAKLLPEFVNIYCALDSVRRMNTNEAPELLPLYEKTSSHQ